MIGHDTADQVWLNLLDRINRTGEPHSPRGQATREILGHQTRVDMRFPIVTNPDRKMGYKFMAAEAAWILSGDDRVSTISPFSRAISKFSDNGETFFGAYGPKIIDQLAYIVKTLEHDPDSRQAVINIWRENPGKSKDIPCSISVQFLIRNNKLHCQYTMRSSDAWLGWVYDVFNFSMLSGVVLLGLGDIYPQLKLGTLTLTAGSQHLYDRDRDGYSAVLTGSRERWRYFPFNPRAQFRHGNHLVSVLWDAAHGCGALQLAQTGWNLDEVN
jgi:thymidylate synthase